MRRHLIAIVALLATACSGCLSYAAWTKVGRYDPPYSSGKAANMFLAGNVATGIAIGAVSNLAADLGGDDVPIERQVVGSVIGGPLVVSIVDAMAALTIVVFSAPVKMRR